MPFRDSWSVIVYAADETECADGGEKGDGPLSDLPWFFWGFLAVAEPAGNCFGEAGEAVMGDIWVEMAVEIEVEDVSSPGRCFGRGHFFLFLFLFRLLSAGSGGEEEEELRAFCLGSLTC